MLPHIHVIFGIIICSIISLIFPISLFELAVIFISSTVLIDLDHYFRYILIKKSVNPFSFWNWYKKGKEKHKEFSRSENRKFKEPLFIFHSVEFWVLILILSFFFPIFLFVLIGIVIHMFVDLAHLAYCEGMIYPKLSIIYTVYKDKNKKKFFDF